MKEMQLCDLHSTMFLLIQLTPGGAFTTWSNLHSTMFLLILSTEHTAAPSYVIFTFHNVSINTAIGEKLESMKAEFTFHNVSINTM